MCRWQHPCTSQLRVPRLAQLEVPLKELRREYWTLLPQLLLRSPRLPTQFTTLWMSDGETRYTSFTFKLSICSSTARIAKCRARTSKFTQIIFVCWGCRAYFWMWWKKVKVCEVAKRKIRDVKLRSLDHRRKVMCFLSFSRNVPWNFTI